MSGTPQRRSTRATKEPERLAPSTPVTPRKRSKALSKVSAFASPVSSPSKRQRVVVASKAKRREISDDDESEASDAASSSEEEEERSDFEESRPTPAAATKSARKKQPAKQAAAPKQRKTVSVDTSRLLDAILDEKTALAQVASDWIASYREAGDAAVCELVNFLIKLTGTPSAPVTEATLYEDVGETLDELQAQSIAALKRGDTGDDGDDLLMGKTKEHRRVRKSVLQFLMRVVGDGQHHLVFDEVNDESRLSPFMEVLLQWLVSMAGSSYRPFRHVATVVSLSVQTAVVGIRARISAELQTTHRQLEAEAKRGSSGRKGVSSRLTQLRERVSQLGVQDEVAEAAFKAFYDTVFIYRYRDVQATIRSECIVPLATWCRAFPAAYLDTEYLRYLGWALNDKDARVRETALAAIGGPLLLGKQPTHGGVGSGVGAPGASASSEDSVAEGIRPFIGRFLPRIVQVAAGDIDVKVQVAALKLVGLLGKHQFLDPTAKIGDIRNIKKSERPGKSSKQKKKKKKKTSRSRGTYSHSLSQQLLEESSSEEEEEEEEEEVADKDKSGVIDIQTLYDEEGSMGDGEEAGQLGCPRHTTMRYLAPLVAHTQAAVRGAAAELVAWWIHEDWARAARVSALGVSHAQADEEEEEEASGDDGDDNDDDVDLLASARGRRRVAKWAVFKGLAGFLAHLTRGDRQRAQQQQQAPSELRAWVAEQSASLVEEVWAGAEVSSDRTTELDAAIGAAAAEGQAPGRLVAAAAALWGRVAELDSLAGLAGYLSRDHSAVRRAFALSPSEETALLQAFGCWAQESAEKARRAKAPAAADTRWQTALPRLLGRHGDDAARVAALAGAAAAVDLQALFDADRSDAVEGVAQHLSAALERHSCVRVVRPAAAFLARVDRSAVLRAPWCLPAAEAASAAGRVNALRALVRAADVSAGMRIEDLAVTAGGVDEPVALAALDSALHAVLWRAVSADSGSVAQLAADRDALLTWCVGLADAQAGDGLRLRELAFVALGRVLRVFTGALVRSDAGRSLALSAASVADIRGRLAAFFDQRMAAWVGARDAGEWHGAACGEAIAYARVCGLAAAWAAWVGDQTLPPAALSHLAALTGRAGIEQRQQQQQKRRVGFVALSAVDHIVQAGVDSIKPLIARERTRGAAVEALAGCLRAAFEAGGDAVNVATLARFVGAALRSAGDAAAAPASAAALAPAPVGAAWAAAHALAIPYGLAAGDWDSRVAPWFVALSQTVAGVLRPRHAHALSLRLADAVADLDDSAAAAAVGAYQKALDKECAKLGAVEARLAETRAALSPPQPARSREPIRPAATADDSMDVDE